MSDPIIILNNISKQYRLFHKPSYRILDALRLPIPKNAYNDFWALRDVNLTINPGDKLGIIGKNGAGKSTLLKIIAQQVTPTSGVAKVTGQIQALMELGTGFHPEFSGWKNIIASLSYMGITGKAAIKEAEMITEFAELEEFIQNPLRTYSAGMYARLAFSVATTIKPNILIIDEILGAGDAYFANKAYERMKELTSGGTTVLFVSHDMSAVEKICDKAIWIERGKIIMQGPTIDVSKAYSDMNRKREQVRLQAKNSLMKLNTLRKIHSGHQNLLQFIFRITNVSTKTDVSASTLLIDNEVYSEIKIGDAQDSNISETAFVLLDKSIGRWSAPYFNKSESWRSLDKVNENSGAIVYNLSGASAESHYIFSLTTKGGSSDIEFYDGASYVKIGSTKSSTIWQTSEISIPTKCIEGFLQNSGLNINPQSEERAQEVSASKEKPFAATKNSDESFSKIDIIKKYGSNYEILTGDIIIEDVIIHSGDGVQKHIYKSFEPLSISLKYRTFNQIDKPEFVVCIHHAGIIALQALSQNTDTSLTVLPKNVRGAVEFHIPSLTFGMGSYWISIGIFPRIDRNSLDTEKTAFLLQDRRYEIQIEQPEMGNINLGLVRAEVEWSFSE